MKSHLEIKRQKRIGKRSSPDIPTRKSQPWRPLGDGEGVARMDAIREKIPFMRPKGQRDNPFHVPKGTGGTVRPGFRDKMTKRLSSRALREGWTS